MIIQSFLKAGILVAYKFTISDEASTPIAAAGGIQIRIQMFWLNTERAF